MLYPFILGIITKVYDDIVDLKLNVSQEVIHILQSVIILFFTLIAHNNFFFAFPCVIVCVLNSGFDNPFWKSLLSVSILLMIISYPIGTNMMLLKMFLSFCAVLGILLLAWIEDKMFPEEISQEKLVFRSLLFFVELFVVLLLTSPFVPLPSFSIQPLLITMMIMLGNVVESISMMSYMMLYENIEELNKKV